MIVGLLLGLLCIMALMPMLLTEIENKRLLGKATVEKVREASIIGKEKNQNIDNMTKLETIVAAQTNKTGSVTDQVRVELEQNEIEQLVASLKDQLLILQQKQAIPNFAISADYDIQFFSRRTMMDSKNPNVYVSIWDLDFLFGEYYVKAYMDTETNQIYQIRIMTRDDAQMDLTNIKFTNFLSYLGIKSSQVSWDVGENIKEFRYYEIDQSEETEKKVNYFCYLDSGYLDYAIQIFKNLDTR